MILIQSALLLKKQKAQVPSSKSITFTTSVRSESLSQQYTCIQAEINLCHQEMQNIIDVNDQGIFEKYQNHVNKLENQKLEIEKYVVWLIALL